MFTFSIAMLTLFIGGFLGVAAMSMLVASRFDEFDGQAQPDAPLRKLPVRAMAHREGPARRIRPARVAFQTSHPHGALRHH